MSAGTRIARVSERCEHADCRGHAPHGHRRWPFRPALEQLLACGVSGRLVERRLDDPIGPLGQIRILHRCEEPLEPALGRVGVARPRHVPDAGVPESDQVLDGEAHPEGIINCHARSDGTGAAIHQDQRQVGADDVSQHRLRGRRAGDHQTVDPTLQKEPMIGLTGLHELLAVGDQKHVARVGGGPLGAVDDLGVDRVRQVGDHEPDGRRALRLQAPRGGVRPVLELRGRRQDPLTGLGPNSNCWVIVEDTRGDRCPDSRARGHVGEPRHPAAGVVLRGLRAVSRHPGSPSIASRTSSS